MMSIIYAICNNISLLFNKHLPTVIIKNTMNDSIYFTGSFEIYIQYMSL